MRAAEIEVDADYAYADPSGPKRHLLKAHTLAQPAQGGTQVRITHPDTNVPDVEKWVPNRYLLGPWLSPPSDPTHPGWGYVREDERDRHKPGPADPMSYAESAAAEYQDVVLQRMRATMLTELGFRRLLADYAGEGGEMRSGATFEERMQRREQGLPLLHADVNTFDDDELERLLSLLIKANREQS